MYVRIFSGLAGDQTGVPRRHGCVFHWTQAVWRHVQSLGLAQTYMERKGVYSFVRLILALPFLPAAHIGRTLAMLEGRASTPETTLLVTYIDRQWVRSSVFPVSTWSVYGRTTRSNNDVEGNYASLYTM